MKGADPRTKLLLCSCAGKNAIFHRKFAQNLSTRMQHILDVPRNTIQYVSAICSHATKNVFDHTLTR